MIKGESAISPTVLYDRMRILAQSMGWQVLTKPSLGKESGHLGTNIGGICKVIWIDSSQPVEAKLNTLIHEIVHIFLPVECMVCEDFAEIAAYIVTHAVLLSWRIDSTKETLQAVRHYGLRLIDFSTVKKIKQVFPLEFFLKILHVTTLNIAMAGHTLKSTLQDSHTIFIPSSVESMQNVFNMFSDDLKDIWE